MSDHNCMRRVALAAQQLDCNAIPHGSDLRPPRSLLTPKYRVYFLGQRQSKQPILCPATAATWPSSHHRFTFTPSEKVKSRNRTTHINKKTEKLMWSSTDSTKDGAEWATPWEFFNELDAQFKFTLDVAASKKNHKCRHYFTKKQDGLAQDWGKNVVWCNPPYGKQIGQWLKKGIEAASKGATVVFLLPARVDTRWFHTYVYMRPCEMRLIKGRLKFEHKNGTKQSASFPSLVVIYYPRSEGVDGFDD
jgi:phage N-6-adenine-methyltransferase